MVMVGFGSQSFVNDRFDPYEFGEIGKSIARGDGFAGYGTLLNRRAPLYPAFIGAVYFAFGEQPMVVLLIQCLLLGGTCWLAFDMGRRLFDERAGALAGLACACHPLMLRYVADLQLETLLTFLFTLTVWRSVRFYEAPSIVNGVLLGIAGGLAALTKAVVVLYPVLFAGLWFLLRLTDRRLPDVFRTALPACLAIGLGMTAVIGPWTGRNYRASGHFVLISTGFNDAFLRGYVFSQTDYALLRRPPYTDAENEANAYFRRLAREAGTEWARDDYETEQVLSRESRRRFTSDPLGFVRKFFVGLGTFWYQMTSLTNSLVVGGSALVAWILAIIGARAGWRRGTPVWLLLLPPLHLNLLLAALLALGRYSAPVMPTLIVLAAFGATSLVARRESRPVPDVAAVPGG